MELLIGADDTDDEHNKEEKEEERRFPGKLVSNNNK